jgi:biotin carboxylase
VRVLHPGAGTVSAVSGVEEARRLPGVERVEIRAEPGQRLRQRVGVGQETGYVLVHGQDRGQVLQQLAAARDTIRIELRSDSPSRSRPVPGSNSEHQSEDAHPSQSS